VTGSQPGAAEVLRARLGLISLDFEDLTELYAAAREREIGWVEVFLGVIRGEDDVVLMQRRAHEDGIRVASVSSLAKLSSATDAELPEHVAMVEQSIDLAQRVGAPFVTFMFGSQSELDGAAARDRFLRRLGPLVAKAAASRVRLLVENVFSRGSWGDLDTVEGTAALLERVDPEHIGLNFDPANFTIAGVEGYPLAYRALKPYIRSIHLKDARPFRDADHPLGTRRLMVPHEGQPYFVVPLGQGGLDLAGLVGELKRDRLDVVMSLEPTAQGAERDEWLDVSLEYLERAGIVSAGRHPADAPAHEVVA
jgi:sugar phosphate isomerase/epimerase